MNQEVRNGNKLLRINAVSELTSLGKSTIWLWVSQGKFPKPISLSPTVKVWRSSDLDAWIEGMSGSHPPLDSPSVGAQGPYLTPNS